MVAAVKDELLRSAWTQIRGWRSDNVTNLPAARRAVEAGALAEDVARAVNCAAYEAVFSLLFTLDDGGDPYVSGRESSAWIAVDLSDGSAIAGLHEDVLIADPTGQEGRDLYR